MMTELFTATAHGKQWICWRYGEGLRAIDLNKNVVTLFESDVTNLQPMRLVKADAVTLETWQSQRIFDLLERLFERGRVITRESSTAEGIRMAQADLQLPTPAESTSLGGMKSPNYETTEVSTTSLGEAKGAEVKKPTFYSEVANCEDCHANYVISVIPHFCKGLNFTPTPKPTPTSVTIELTDDKGFSEETCVRCGWRMGRQPLNCNNDNTPHVFPSQLNPPPMEEPKEFGAVVEAHTKAFNERRVFVRFNGDILPEYRCWIDEYQVKVAWSDLISPTRVGGGEK